MRRLIPALLFCLIAVSAAAQEEGVFGDVVIRCNDADAEVLASIRFQQTSAIARYVVQVYGLDGLQPAFAWQTTLENDLEPCREGEPAENVTISLGGETISDGIQRAELTIDTDTDYGTISIAFASLNGTRGRFIAFVQGFALDTPEDQYQVEVDAGAYAIAETPLLLYMLKTDPDSRLDPQIEDSVSEIVCDDAGRRGCESVPYAADYAINDGAIQLVGGRFDAGYQIAAGDLNAYALLMGSRGGRTSGLYALMLVGAIR